MKFLKVFAMLSAMEALSAVPVKPRGLMSRIRMAVQSLSSMKPGENRVVPIETAPGPPITAFEGPPMVPQDPVLTGVDGRVKPSAVRAGRKVVPVDTVEVDAQPSVDGGKTPTNPVIDAVPSTGRALSSESASSATVVVEEEEAPVEAEFDATGSCAALVEEPSAGAPPVVDADMGAPAGAGSAHLVIQDRSTPVAADLDLATLQAQQIVDDAENARYKPVLYQVFEEIPPPVCRREVGAYIASSHYSTVFALSPARSRYPLVIKYQGDCDTGADATHPLLIDYWFARAASEHGLSPTPLFISPPRRMIRYCEVLSHCVGPAASKIFLEDHGILNKLQFNVFNDDASVQARRCMANGQVRYMVMERVGECLDSRLTNPLSPPEAVRVGIRVIRMLEELHQTARVIHGDIHPGNICSILGGDPLTDLVFIDFGYASAVSDEGKCDGEKECLPAHPALTPWQLGNYGFNRRDDVFKAVYMIAGLMFGNLLERNRKSICNRPDAVTSKEAYAACVYMWKTKGFFFNPIKSIRQVHDALMGVHHMVMNLTHVTDAIPYPAIITGLKKAHKAMAGVTFGKIVS